MEIISPKQILKNLAEKLANTSSADDKQAGVALVSGLVEYKFAVVVSISRLAADANMNIAYPTDRTTDKVIVAANNF